jgi:hypothetical protein
MEFCKSLISRKGLGRNKPNDWTERKLSRLNDRKWFCMITLETAVQDDKVMQDFELESFLMGGDHSQKVKAPPIRSDYGSKNCVNLSSSNAVSRIIQTHFESIQLRGFGSVDITLSIRQMSYKQSYDVIHTNLNT